MNLAFLTGSGTVLACSMVFLLVAARFADWGVVPARRHRRVRSWVRAAPWVLACSTVLIVVGHLHP